MPCRGLSAACLGCALFVLVVGLAASAHAHGYHAPPRSSPPGGHDHHGHDHDHDHIHLPFEHNLGEYNMGLHIGAVFIVVGVSLLGSLGPVILSLFHLAVNDFVLSLGLCIGAGTILSTALIHMVVPAVQALSSPILGKIWSEEYTSLAGVVTMAAMLGMQLLEYFVVSYFHNHSNSTAQGFPTGDLGHRDQSPGSKASAFAEKPNMAATAPHHAINVAGSSGGPVVPVSSTGPTFHQHESLSMSLTCPHESFHAHHPSLIGDMQAKRLAVYLLEAGVAIHSVIIGVALGVNRGPEFVTLLIAICFHQLFEGFALGSAVVEANFGSRLTLFALVLVYGVTTPLGIGIGMAIHDTYDESSKEAILVSGIFDALSAGILIYTALVHLITPELTDNEQFRKRSTLWKVSMFAGLYLGAALMAVIGRWA